MSTRSFVVTISAAGASSSRVWDLEREPEFKLGHPMRWVLSRTEKGVCVRNVASDAQVVVSEASLASGKALDLPDGAREIRSSLSVHLRPVVCLPPAYETHPRKISGQLRVYACQGDWTQGYETVSSAFTGKQQGRKVFTLDRSPGSSQWILIARAEGVKFETPSGQVVLKKGRRHEFTLADLAGSCVVEGDSRWRLEALDAVTEPGPAPLEETDERLILRRSFGGALASMLVLALISALLSHWSTPAPVANQVTRIVFKRPVHGLMTAAAQGDSAARDTSQGTHGPRHNARGSEAARKDVKRSRQASAHPVAKAKPVLHAMSKARQAPVSRPRPQPKPQLARRKPVPHQPSVADSALARAFRGASVRQARAGLMAGGMTPLLRESRFAAGADGRSAAKGMLSAAGRTNGLGGAAPSNGSVSAADGSLTSFGGGGSGGASGIHGVSSPGYGRGSHAAVSGQGRSFVSTDPGASDVAEGLTKDQVGAVIRKHMSEIRYCYEAAMVRSPEVEGKLGVNFVIGPNGVVKTSQAGRSSLADPKLDHCVVSRLATWKFPKPRGGVNVAVNYPFIFKTLGR
jgi:hypothetical protein